MRQPRTWVITGVLVAAGALGGPVAGAAASAKSIKAVIKSYNSKIDVAEGHVLTALGTYETDHVAAPLETAITESVAVLNALRAKVAHQPAAKPKVRKARTLIVKGLGELIASYGNLKTAFSEKATEPEAAKVAATAALVEVAAGRKRLLAGVKLLG
jgi:hypothetical protein